MERIFLESDALLKLLHSAYSSFDRGSFNEKIGVVIGKGNVLSDVVEATKESAPAFCSLNHEKVFEAYKSLAEGEVIKAWYHTHNGFHTPSSIDERTQSYWQAFPGTLSVIVDVRNAKIMVWRMGLGGVEEVPFAVTHNPHLSPLSNLSQLFRKQDRHVEWKRMQRKRATVFGVGELGTLTATGLSKSGLGELRLVDRDRVELRNVNSQILYSLEDVGKFKVKVLAERLSALAPWTRIEGKHIEVPMGGEEDKVYGEKMRQVREFMTGCDVAISCLDNVRSRITVNLLCHGLGMPLIDAGTYGLNGQVLTTIWDKTPCIGCLDIKGEGDMSCAIAPTTVPTGFAVSCVQTQVAIDLLHRRPVPACVAVDLSSFTTKQVEIKRREGCWICG